MLLDTSGLICLLYRSEPFHELAVTFYASAAKPTTHNLVLAEFVALAQVRGLARQPCLRFVQDLMTNRRIRLVWVDEAIHAKGMALLFGRPDKDYSFCDAVSFAIMNELALTEALTTDHHFEQEGFRRLLV